MLVTCTFIPLKGCVLSSLLRECLFENEASRDKTEGGALVSSIFTWTPGDIWAWNKTSKFLYDTCREVDNRRRWLYPKCKWPCTIPWMLHLTWQTDRLSSGTQWRTMFRVADSFCLNPRWLTIDIWAARQLMKTEQTENRNPVVWKLLWVNRWGHMSIKPSIGPFQVWPSMLLHRVCAQKAGRTQGQWRVYFWPTVSLGELSSAC